MTVGLGQQIRESDLLDRFYQNPGQVLVSKLLDQLSKVPGMVDVFGPYLGIGIAEQRWADYSRHDWSLRQLPAISVYEAEPETKQSSHGWLTGTIQIQAVWPASLRRTDNARVPRAFMSAMLSFFESWLARNMLDEFYEIERAEKVPGLNELGKEMSWTPNVEGIVETELVPVTMISVRYRIDLRAFYRWLTNVDLREKGTPFEKTVAPLAVVGGEYDGVPETDAEDVQATVEQEVLINP
jgi:hypothetical protein